MKIAIPGGAPPALRNSAAWPGLAARAELDYHDTLPGSEERLIKRICSTAVVHCILHR